jgi:DNA sulfur modification protein DndB
VVIEDMNQQKTGELKVPGLRAHMGDWVYYISFLRFKDVAERVSLAQELHTSKALKDLIQREVDESVHSQSIKTYLLRQDQRLFNALVIAVYDGVPTWAELKIDDKAGMGLGVLPGYMKGALGVLVFDGTEKLFAVDGQHRVVGIKRAVAEKQSLGDEEVCVVFVGHSSARKGLQRTRRLFTTLNRYAKPVNKTEIIALDEDDAIAILTRRLLESYRLLKEFTSIKKGKNIPANDRKNLTTIVTVYDTLDKYLGSGGKDWRDFKKQRPGERQLDVLYKQATELWDGLVSEFAPLKELLASAPDDEISFKYRNRNVGGHLFFRPVGLLMIISVIRYLKAEGKTLKQAIAKVAAAPMSLSEEPWSGLLWDSANHRMTVSGERQSVATRILLHGTGGRIEIFKTTPEKLRDEWAGIIDKPKDEVRLPVWKK